MTHQYIPQRPLGMFEKNQLAKQLTKGYASVTLTAVLHHPPRTISPAPFYKRYLYSALSPLIQQHPMLRLTVANIDQPSVHFVQLTRLRLDDLVMVTDQDAFWNVATQERIITEECQHEFNLFGMVPLWRLRVSCHPDRLDQCSITLSLQHVIADGLSTTIIWHDILRNLNNDNLENLDDKEMFDTSGTCDVPLPIEHRHGPYDPTISPQDPMPADGWQGDFPAPDNETLDTVLRLVKVDRSIWMRLVDKAKTRGVSMHAVIYASYLLSWMAEYPDRSVKTVTAINCRPYCHVPDDELGIFFGRYELGWPLADLASCTSFWTLAKDYHDLIQRNKLLTCQRSLLMGDSLPAYPDDYCNVWYDARKKYAMGRSGGLNMSDLGRFGYSVDGSWTLHDMWFAQSAHTFATILALNVITVNESMHAAITWQRGSVQENKALGVIDLFVSRLEKEAYLD
ncbi:alcohol acetyltransferase [Chlamydoabsidia padenii]|nr:alcohol acetyltransferase [Chlamydoabsidia padenii]